MAGRAPAVVAVVLAALLVTGGAAALLNPAPRTSGPARPASGPGGSTVTLGPDAAAHPDGEVVRSLMQRHFDAINTRNYSGWRDTVVPERAAALQEPAWLQAYATTFDGTVRVDRIDDTVAAEGAALLIRVRFISVQDPSAAPEQARAARLCWRSTLPLTGQPRKIAQTNGGSSVPEPC